MCGNVLKRNCRRYDGEVRVTRTRRYEIQWVLVYRSRIRSVLVIANPSPYHRSVREAHPEKSVGDGELALTNDRRIGPRATTVPLMLQLKVSH